MGGLHEECGIFGIYDKSRDDLAHTTYYGLVSLQHRGQESCGIAVNKNRDISYYKDEGLVNDVFNNEILDKLKGNMAVGHVRYSTSGGVGRENAQPLVLRYKKGNLAIAHNGNLRNANELRKEYEETGAIYQTTSDTEVLAYTIARQRVLSKSIDEAISKSMDILKGSYSLVVMSPEKLIAARDPWGFRPLCMGKLGESIVFASESCAFDSVGAEYVRDIDPGEIVIVDKNGIRTDRTHCDKHKPSPCIFEYIYFSRPDSHIGGQLVYDSRKLAGRILAKEHPVEADIVFGVPDSGVPAGVGYSAESGIPYEEGFIKSRYIGRTFIKPDQNSREIGVRMKLNPLKTNVNGKRVIMVDDSIVRGTTCATIISLLRKAGAKEVHVRISSPPFLNPCYFGTDIPVKEDLIANNQTIEGIRKYLGADSLGYLSVESLEKTIPNAKCGFCDACFTGNYPV